MEGVLGEETRQPVTVGAPLAAAEPTAAMACCLLHLCLEPRRSRDDDLRLATDGLSHRPTLGLEEEQFEQATRIEIDYQRVRFGFPLCLASDESARLSASARSTQGVAPRPLIFCCHSACIAGSKRGRASVGVAMRASLPIGCASRVTRISPSTCSAFSVSGQRCRRSRTVTLFMDRAYMYDTRLHGLRGSRRQAPFAGLRRRAANRPGAQPPRADLMPFKVSMFFCSAVT